MPRFTRLKPSQKCRSLNRSLNLNLSLSLSLPLPLAAIPALASSLRAKTKELSAHSPQENGRFCVFLGFLAVFPGPQPWSRFFFRMSSPTKGSRAYSPVMRLESWGE